MSLKGSSAVLFCVVITNCVDSGDTPEICRPNEITCANADGVDRQRIQCTEDGAMWLYIASCDVGEACGAAGSCVTVCDSDRDGVDGLQCGGRDCDDADASIGDEAARTGCYGSQVYEFARCGERSALLQTCDCGCVDGTCRPCPNCEPNDQVVCHAGDIYWRDSCGTIGALHRECADGCDDAACCGDDREEFCKNGDVWQRDTCGNAEVLAACGQGQRCVSWSIDEPYASTGALLVYCCDPGAATLTYCQWGRSHSEYGWVVVRAPPCSAPTIAAVCADQCSDEGTPHCE